MRDDDELCLCFHVTRRKVEQFLRNTRPAAASMLSECYGAGTGCGWCRPFLQRLHQQIVSGDGATGSGDDEVDMPDAASYAVQRREYRRRQAKRSES